MSKFVRSTRPVTGARLMGPLALLALVVSAPAAFAVGDGMQAKPSLKVEAERSPQGARLTFNGKGWAPAARLKITATRAPGSSAPQDFGMITADSSGNFQVRKTTGCTTESSDMSREGVQVTAADSATGVKVTARADGSAWQCM